MPDGVAELFGQSVVVIQPGFERGPDFTALAAQAANPNYAFWREGIRRHLRNCEAVLAEPPADG